MTSKISMQLGTWEDFSKQVQQLEPELAQIINDINPGKKHQLIKVQYRFGENITKLGKIYLPNAAGKPVAIDDPSFDPKLKALLDYGSTPLMLQLVNAAEVFIDAADRIIPFNVHLPGTLYGLYEGMEPITGQKSFPCWSVTSGVRSTFMGAKITDNIGHRKIRGEFGLTEGAPRTLMDHWQIFKTIANRVRFEDPWTSEVLLFTKPWFEHPKNNAAWLRLENYFLKKAWQRFHAFGAKLEYENVIWELFAKIISDKRLRPDSYVLDTIRHLMMIGNHSALGFSAIDDKETLLPSKAIEDAYTDVYQLKEYAPIIMAPIRFDQIKMPKGRLYYSLNYPTLMTGSPAIRKPLNTILELREFRRLINLLLELMYDHDLSKGLDVKYFHSEKDKFEQISKTEDIPKYDAWIQEVLQTRFPNRIFPDYGPFFRGCIGIAHR